MEEENVSNDRIYFAIRASELNEQAEQAGWSERITQQDFEAAMEFKKKIDLLLVSGQNRIIRVNTWALTSEPVIYDFDTEKGARELASEEIQGTREFRKEFIKKTIVDPGKDGELVEAAKEAIEWIEDGNICTDEVMYLYDPEGGFIDEFPI